MGIVLFWLLWGGVFLLAILYIAMYLATTILFTMGRKPLLGIVTFVSLVTICGAISLYVLLSTFALGPGGHVSDASLEIGAFAFLTVATAFVIFARNSGQVFIYVARRYRATRLLRDKRYAESLERFFQMAAKYPTDAYSWFGQTQALIGLHRNIEALAACERAMEAATMKRSSALLRAQIWLIKGNILFSMHRIADALAALDHSLALTPNYPLAWAQKAYILYRTGLQEQALAAAEHALNGKGIAKAKVWQGMALIAKAGALNSRGKYQEALDTARGAWPLAPQSSTVWIIQAEALSNLGRPVESHEAAIQGLDKVE